MSSRASQPQRLPHLGTLWSQHDFRKLWAGEAVSLLGSTPGVIICLMGAFFLRGGGYTACNVQVNSVRQVITPDRLRGSANAAFRLLVSGVIALGALLGGVLGGWIGLPLTLLVGAVGTSCSWLWLLCSPLSRLRQLPAPVDEAPPSLARGAVDSEVNLPSSSGVSSAEKQDNVLPAVIVGSDRRSDPSESDR